MNEVHLMAQCREIEKLVDARPTRSDGEVDQDEAVEHAMTMTLVMLLMRSDLYECSMAEEKMIQPKDNINWPLEGTIPYVTSLAPSLFVY